MKRPSQFALLFVFAIAAGSAVLAQEGPVPTQVLVNVDAKSTPPASASVLTVSVNNHKEALTAWEPVAPGNTQVALLIDDGLREAVGRELDNLRQFVNNLPPGVEVLVGYMQYGHVVSDHPFTVDHALAASGVHLPEGLPGMSASPYICLSDFVKNWPSGGSSSSSASSTQHKARFVLMLTDGVDPYNGSTSVMNQESPYVDASIRDSQRAGVSVYAIYFGDAGIHGGSAANSGQSYLSDLTQETGGVSLWEGIGNPVSTAPFLTQFQRAVAETYIATFIAPTGNNPELDMAHVKFSAPKTKLHSPDEVLPGNQE